MPARLPSIEASDSWRRRATRIMLGDRPTRYQRLQILAALTDPLSGKTGVTLWPEQETILFGLPPESAAVDQICITGAMQAGKSFVTSADLVTRIPWYPPRSVCWLVGPTYWETRAERKLILPWLDEMGWVDYPNSSLPRGLNEPWAIATVFGSMIYGLSSSKPERLASEAPIHIIGCEIGQQSLETLHTLRARATMHNSRLVLSGTVERSQPWYPRLIRRWKLPNPEGGRAYPLPAWANRTLYPEGYASKAIQKAREELPKDVFDRRFAGEPTPPEGLVFHDFVPELHGRTVKWGPRPTDADPWALYLPSDLPVEIAIDPGFRGSAYAVLAVAEYSGQTIFFDEVHVRGMVHQDVIRLCQGRSWWRQVGTAGETAGVIDLAGTTHSGGGTPGTEVWAAPVRDGGAGLRLRAQFVPVRQGIDLMHMALRPDPLTGQPSMVVDTAACPHFVWELTEAYQHRTDRDGEVLGEEPVDKRNDACKAAAYYLFDRRGPLAPDARVNYGTQARSRWPWERDPDAA